MEAENARGPQSSTVGVEKQLSVSELHEIEVLLMVQVVASSFGGQVTDSCHACQVIGWKQQTSPSSDDGKCLSSH